MRVWAHSSLLDCSQGVALHRPTHEPERDAAGDYPYSWHFKGSRVLAVAVSQHQQSPGLIIPKHGADSHVARQPVYKPHEGPQSIVNLSAFSSENRRSHDRSWAHMGFINRFAGHMRIGHLFGMMRRCHRWLLFVWSPNRVDPTVAVRATLSPQCA